MAELIVLGSSNAIPTPGHENTHFIILGRERNVLVDCASNPIVRLEQAGVPLDSINDVILTHFHPDHVSGVPLLLMDLWLLGRHAPLNIYGLDFTLERLKTLMDLYSWSQWPDFFPVNFLRIPDDKMAVVLDASDMCIYASQVEHFLPNVGLRFEFKAEDKVLAYSCDTEPCSSVVQLASGADILLHEAAGLYPGHSSAAQAAEIARQAEVGMLYLIHYPTGRFASDDLLSDAQAHYLGPVHLATDFLHIPIE